MPMKTRVRFYFSEPEVEACESDFSTQDRSCHDEYDQQISDLQVALQDCLAGCGSVNFLKTGPPKASVLLSTHPRVCSSNRFDRVSSGLGGEYESATLRDFGYRFTR